MFTRPGRVYYVSYSTTGFTGKFLEKLLMKSTNENRWFLVGELLKQIQVMGY
jgi:hypothetical protein